MTDAFKDFLSREFQAPAQVAEFGAVSKGTVYGAIERGDLPALKHTPRLFRVRTLDALAWLHIPFPAESERQQ